MYVSRRSPVFRQGDVGTNWYAVLSGSLDMNVSDTGDAKVPVIHLYCDNGIVDSRAVYTDSPVAIHSKADLNIRLSKV